MYAEAMFYITVQRNNKLTQVLYSRSLLSRRLDKYTSNFKINVVISAINQVGVPSYSCTSGLLKVRGGHVTCSDQWNLHHTSFLSRNLRAWVICYSLLSFTLVTDSAPDGGSSVCPAAKMRMKWPVTDLQYEWEVNCCFKPLRF